MFEDGYEYSSKPRSEDDGYENAYDYYSDFETYDFDSEDNYVGDDTDEDMAEDTLSRLVATVAAKVI